MQTRGAVSLDRPALSRLISPRSWSSSTPLLAIPPHPHAMSSEDELAGAAVSGEDDLSDYGANIVTGKRRRHPPVRGDKKATTRTRAAPSGSASPLVAPPRKRKAAAVVNSSSEDEAAIERRQDVDPSDSEDEFGGGGGFASASGFLAKLLGSNRERERPVKDLGALALKPDHASRPLWIDNRGKM